MGGIQHWRADRRSARRAPDEAALEAFFGGGSKAIGGWGRDFGSTALKASGVGLALFSIGVALKMAGARRIEAADDFGDSVENMVKNMGRRDELLRAVQGWAREQHELITRAIDEATEALDILESESYDDTVHQPRLQEALLLSTMVRLLVAIVVAESGNTLGEGRDRLTFTYRDADEETPDA